MLRRNFLKLLAFVPFVKGMIPKEEAASRMTVHELQVAIVEMSKALGDPAPLTMGCREGLFMVIPQK